MTTEPSGRLPSAEESRFKDAIVREAVEFATKVMALSDPKLQAEHLEGLAQIARGESVTLEELEAKISERRQQGGEDR